DRALRQGSCARRGAQPDEVLRRGIVRPVHPVPRRHREGGRHHAPAGVEQAAARRPLPGDGRRVDLRPRAGGTESDRVCLQVFPARTRHGERLMNAPFDGQLGFRPAGTARSVKAHKRAAVAPDAPRSPGPDIAFKLNGDDVLAKPGETIIEVADRLGVSIPRLCYKPGYRPDGNCRACMVEIKGERVLAPSCCRQPAADMQVTTDSPRALHSQKMIVELLASDMPERTYKTASELDYWKRALGIEKPRFAKRAQPAADLSHPAMAVNLDACIQCTRCVRACREEQVNDVIGYAFRGAHSKIVFDLDDPMGVSTCVACGECVQV